MTQTTENPPAFPRVGEGFGNPLYDTPGMSLRDWFAGQALPAIVAATSAGQHHPELIGAGVENAIARDAYDLADAMLAARGDQP